MKNISLSVISSTGVMISWLPPLDLPGWNISYYYLTYKTYNLEEDGRLVHTIIRTVDGGSTSETMSDDQFLVQGEVSHVFEVVAALKIEGLEGIGEVKGEVAVLNANLTAGMCS